MFLGRVDLDVPTMLTTQQKRDGQESETGKDAGQL
jgi:hypothetical protein